LLKVSLVIGLKLKLKKRAMLPSHLQTSLQHKLQNFIFDIGSVLAFDNSNNDTLELVAVVDIKLADGTIFLVDHM